jgi:hypothetical protein
VLEIKIGTKSLLFGVHQIFIHTYLVTKSWKILYRKLPTFKEFICIMIHDWGYWGCPNMDGAEGDKHPETGAKIANRLFGKQYGDLCLYHSRHYAKRNNVEPSKLCWADKYSTCLEPKKFYLFRARLTRELNEYRLQSANAGFCSLNETDEDWFDWAVGWLKEQAIKQKSSVKLVH